MKSADDASMLVKYKDIAARVSDNVKLVALLYGGNSDEREVSIASGMSVKEVLEKEGFSVLPVDTGKTGFIKELIEAKPDIAFIALHGKGGEDGCIQGFLETVGIPYTQSGVESSAIAMDKRVSKIIYTSQGLKTPAFVEIPQGQKADEVDIDSIIKTIGLPCVIKPAHGGSSLEVSIPKTREELQAAIKGVFATPGVLLIEEFVHGVEITIPVIGNKPEELFALPAIEIVPKNEFYDYESKYTDGGSKHIVPARITSEEAERSRVAAIKAHEALGCFGVSRTDMIISEDGEPWIIETNTVPGMTRTSLIPESARHFGLSPGELYRLLMFYALERDY